MSRVFDTCPRSLEPFCIVFVFKFKHHSCNIFRIITKVENSGLVWKQTGRRVNVDSCYVN